MHLLFEDNGGNDYFGNKLKNIFFAILLLLFYSPDIMLSSQMHTCTKAEAMAAEQSIVHLRDWTEIYDWFKSFAHCDDGAMAEGYSDAVATTIANKWDQLYLLNTLISSDKNFKDFVIKHIDEIAGDNILQKIINNCTYRCQKKFKAICAEIKKASKMALKGNRKPYKLSEDKKGHN